MQAGPLLQASQGSDIIVPIEAAPWIQAGLTSHWLIDEYNDADEEIDNDDDDD